VLRFDFSFGDDSISTSALSMAEAYAIMAREGLAASHRFANTRPTSAPYQSYLLYRDYDGKGAKVTGDSIRATAQADLNYLTIYAQHDHTKGVLYVKLFNKDGMDAINVTVNVENVSVPSGVMGAVYQFQALHAQKVELGSAGSVSLKAGSESSASFNLTLPVRTASLIEFKGVTSAKAKRGDTDITSE
jgi:alpha-L-arabinofuranosidase